MLFCVADQNVLYFPIGSRNLETQVNQGAAKLTIVNYTFFAIFTPLSAYNLPVYLSVLLLTTLIGTALHGLRLCSPARPSDSCLDPSVSYHSITKITDIMSTRL